MRSIILVFLTVGCIYNNSFLVDCLSLNGKSTKERSNVGFFVTPPILLGYSSRNGRRLWLSSSSSNEDGFSSFCRSLNHSGLPPSTQSKILDAVQSTGWTSSEELLHFAVDFQHRPEVLSQVLQNDFHFPPLTSHQLRAALMNFVRFHDQNQPINQQQQQQHEQQQHKHEDGVNKSEKNTAHRTHSIVSQSKQQQMIITPSLSNFQTQSEISNQSDNFTLEEGKSSKVPFKSFVVNEKAKTRFQNKDNYGLPKDFSHSFPVLYKEITTGFLNFMTKPIAAAQESPIREATATVYLRHARLFLGWYLNYNGHNKHKEISLVDIIPSSDRESVQPIIDFILWLRQTRTISESYETNLLRGLTKLLKYRFAKESRADPSYGEKSYQDIAAVREMRKLHKDAQNRQNNSPRSSQEERKWLSWDEYLKVVENLRNNVQENLSLNAKKGGRLRLETKRRIATEYQYYLILAFMACVPDRQRTFRELVVGKTFVRDDNLQCWTICHGPEDYKTGKTYGQRPPLILSADLTSSIDDFLSNWRPYLLKPNEQTTDDTFFLQSRTGKPMTSDSIYKIVARCCYKQTGKKTNPHLLRDMIVTHVRSSPDTSEQQLEALALYMGHSVEMQRNSYDRRTMQQKVAPAVELLQNVNKQTITNE